ncbi:I78 family peptidase inhibitor [Pseudomonas sp. NPDC090202]|uniref:I78 family peptidase inhibitor n=1 Tax=unclassified Pseudomonas TaxID=196821 RepID=UPI00382C5658
MPWKYASSGLVMVVALLAGCSSSPESSTQPAQDSANTETGHSRCDAASAQFAVGKPASPELLEQARVKAGAQTARVLGPRDMVTLEYRSDRLNLNTDQAATVVRVNCG